MIGGGDLVPVERRAVLLDGAAGALVADDGTVDWWAPDGLAAAPAFWRLLDPGGGALRVGPVGTPGRPPQRGRQRWSSPTSSVCTTRFSTPGGVLEVRDLLPRPGDGPGDGSLLRVLDCVGGAVDVEVALAPGRAWRRSDRFDAFDGGVAFDGLLLRAPGFAFASGPVVPGSGAPGALASATLVAGDRRWVHVAAGTARPGGRTHAGLGAAEVRDLLERTDERSAAVADEVRSSGPWAPAVRRSALVVRGLLAEGWLARSATTSLPVAPGVERTVDGRHAWLVDAAAAVPLLVDIGLEEEAAAIARSLGDVLREGGPVVPARRLDGTRPAPAEERRDVAGRLRTQPVLEGVGDEVDLERDDRSSVAALVTVAAATRARSWPEAARLADRLAGVQEGDPAGDEGLALQLHPPHERGPWQLARAGQPLVAPLLATWHALRAARDEGRRRALLDLAPVAWHRAGQQVAAALEAAVHRDGWLPMAASGDLALVPDAALLRLAWEPATPLDPDVAAGTVAVVLRRLGEGPLVRAYPGDVADGLPPGDGPRLACSFDAVRALAALGRWEEAHDRMDRLVGIAEQRLGVLSRSIDPVAGTSLGDVPDVTAHLSLIAAAVALDAGPR